MYNENSVNETGDDQEIVDRLGEDEDEAVFSLDEDPSQGQTPEISVYAESHDETQTSIPESRYNLRSKAKVANINITEIQEASTNPLVVGDKVSHESETISKDVQAENLAKDLHYGKGVQAGNIVADLHCGLQVNAEIEDKNEIFSINITNVPHQISSWDNKSAEDILVHSKGYF